MSEWALWVYLARNKRFPKGGALGRLWGALYRKKGAPGHLVHACGGQALERKGRAKEWVGCMWGAADGDQGSPPG